MDLNAPLGQPAKAPPRGAAKRRRTRLALIIGVLVGVGGLAALVTMLAPGDPHGDEPSAVATIAPRAPKRSQPPLDPETTGSLPASSRAHLPAVSPPVAAPVPTVASASQAPLIIDVAKVLAEREHGAILAAPTELAPHEMPALAPTPPVAPGLAPQPPSLPLPQSHPRVAIFVSGMGLSAAATRSATELMPAAVTFAFVPYGDAIAAAVSAAKLRGHEILLQIPMQSAAGAPPGPHALRPGEAAGDAAADVAWAMQRLEGYDGVTNLLGTPVTLDREVMGALLKAVSSRGLFYLDDGTSKRSLALTLASEQGLPAARADVVLDATDDPAAVRANLESLVAIAKAKGAAIGMASGLPDHLLTIAAFADRLESRGVTLVPVSALVGRGASVTVAR